MSLANPPTGFTSSTGTASNASVTNGNTVVVASNSIRRGATVYNEGAATVYLALGFAATTTVYTEQLISGGYYEAPFGFTGAINGITSSGTATCRVTEFT